jgi:hypothetical protein
LDVLVKATVLLLAAMLADRAMSRGSVATRHRLWSTAMLMLLLLPILSATVPQWRLAILPSTWGDVFADASAEELGAESVMSTKSVGETQPAQFESLAQVANEPVDRC